MSDPNDLLVRAEAEEAAEVAALEERASPFRALYAHWERNQWSRSRSISRPTGGASRRSTRRRRRAWCGSSRTASTPSSGRPAARAVPARRADLRRAAAARHAGRRRAPPPPGRAPHLRRGVRRARRHRRRPRGRRSQHGPRGRGASTSGSSIRRAALGDDSDEDSSWRGRRLPPARRGRDRAHGAEPGGHQYERLSFPGLRGPAPGRARRGAPHRDRRVLRPPSDGEPIRRARARSSRA